MPKYKNPVLAELIIKGKLDPIRWDEFVIYYKRSLDLEHKNLLLFTYLTGIRPSEIDYLTREKFEKEGKWIIVHIQTMKKGIERVLYIPICNDQTKALKDFIFSKVFPKEYVFSEYAKVKNKRDKFIEMNRKYEVGRWINGHFYPFSFYVFRHNILTLLAENGADFLELQIFKGARLPKSLFGSASYYIHHSQKIAKHLGHLLKKIMS